MSGLRYAALHSGAGRPTGKTRKVADVEELCCPSGGTHVLRNSSQRGGLVTACVKCDVDWSTLDARALMYEAPAVAAVPAWRMGRAS